MSTTNIRYYLESPAGQKLMEMLRAKMDELGKQPAAEAWNKYGMLQRLILDLDYYATDADEDLVYEFELEEEILDADPKDVLQNVQAWIEDDEAWAAVARADAYDSDSDLVSAERKAFADWDAGF